MSTLKFVAVAKTPIGGGVLFLATMLTSLSVASAATFSDVAPPGQGFEAAQSHSLAPPRISSTAADTLSAEAEMDTLRLASATESGSESVAVAISEPVGDGTNASNEDHPDESDQDDKIEAKPQKNPITETDYEALVNNAAGFGRNTTGGLGGEICRVTSLDNGGGGSLRNCAIKGDTWVVFDVSGEIALESPIRIANNTTIDGRGADITITGRGLSTSKRDNIIIHNLKIDRIYDDGIYVHESKDIWINHVTVGATTDGAIDIIGHSRDITVSWTHLKEQNKTMLIGNNNRKFEDIRIKVTLHHNWYDSTVRRNPLVRFGKVHMYNNVHTNWDDDAVNSVYQAQLLLESNVYEAGANKQAVQVTVPGWLEVPGYINARGNSPLNGARVFSSNKENVFEASTYYTYRLDVPTSDLANTVKTYAGWQPAEFFESDVFAAEAEARGTDQD